MPSRARFVAHCHHVADSNSFGGQALSADSVDATAAFNGCVATLVLCLHCDANSVFAFELASQLGALICCSWCNSQAEDAKDAVSDTFSESGTDKAERKTKGAHRTSCAIICRFCCYWMS